MKRPTVTEAALGLTLAVIVGAPLGIYLARPEPAHAVIQPCTDGSAPVPGGYPNDPFPVCQVGSIRNP